MCCYILLSVLLLFDLLILPPDSIRASGIEKLLLVPMYILCYVFKLVRTDPSSTLGYRQDICLSPRGSTHPWRRVSADQNSFSANLTGVRNSLLKCCGLLQCDILFSSLLGLLLLVSS